MRAAILAALTVIILIVPCAQGATAKLYDVNFRPSPELDDVIRDQNINNQTQQLATTISEWQTDLGPSVMPNGTYWGTYFTGSKFQNNYKPVWYEELDTYNLDQYVKLGVYSYGLIAAHFNWSSQVIMNGASEWWVRLPISPQSVEISNGLAMAIFKNRGTNASTVQLETGYMTNFTSLRPSINGYAPDDLVLYNFNGTFRGLPLASMGYSPSTHITFTTGFGLISYSDRIYLRVDSILRPETDYIIAIVWRIPTALGASSSIYTYWAGPDNLTGRWSHFAFAEMRFDNVYCEGNTYGLWNVTQTGNTSLDRRLDMDWSFIFTEGIGAGGLFGKNLKFISNSTFTLYPFFNTSRAGYQHMSFMLPFISPTNVTVEPEIHQGIGHPRGFGPAWANHVWAFSDMTWEFDPNIYYNYSDFILFSSSMDLRFGSSGYQFRDNDRWNVRVDFNFLGVPPSLNVTRYYNITLLCYERVHAPVLWSSIDENESTPWNSSYYPWALPHLETQSYTQYLYYGVYCSARGTDGQWAMQTGTLSGNPVYTYHFPQIIWIDPMEWKLSKEGAEEVIRVSQEDGYFAQQQDWWGEHYFGESIRSKFWTFADEYGGGEGTVRDYLSEMGDAFAEFGKWVYVVAVSFVGQLIKFIGEALDALTAIALNLVWLVGPVALMFEVGLGAKMARKMTHRTDQLLDELED